ncbi:endonuclease III domain-containing protein [Fontivita pretiosa]|uniref:endonuclease III domain-containing protein n=1 Tax=Fontivita pretiosa TaxID=2989684 RepID=UPI003D171981
MHDVLCRAHDLLTRTYGQRSYRCWGRGVDVLIDTILSQNTTAANAQAGYRRLKKWFRTWNQVMAAPVDQIERCIRISGLSRTKAPRIQQILRQIKAERGKIDVQFLADINPCEGYQYLMRFKGVGPKTAACTLLFAFGKSVFPVDTHIYRIALRLGLIRPGTSVSAAQEQLTAMIPAPQRYAMHVLLIEHGRKICHARRPRCGQCPLLELCDYGRRHGVAASRSYPACPDLPFSDGKSSAKKGRVSS